MQVLRLAIAHDLKMINEKYCTLSIRIDKCIEELREVDQSAKADFEDCYRRLIMMANELKGTVAIAKAGLNQNKDENESASAPKGRASRKRDQ